VRVLDATRSLLVDKGYTGTTIQAVATLSGVTVSAIYRRWPSRLKLIEEAVFPGFGPLRMEPTGALQEDLTRFIDAYQTTFVLPSARAAIAGITSEYASSPASQPDRDYLRITVRPLFYEILSAAPDGSVDPQVDPDDVFDMLLGTLVIRSMVPLVGQRSFPTGRLVALLLRLLSPEPPLEETSPTH
jgi:AcrR family transcriptional regulator